jgi:quinolinate synthase
MFLGAHVRRITGRENIHVWMGECHVHAGIDPEHINLQRAAHPAPSSSSTPSAAARRRWSRR